ncbi:MAG: hypothetical protein ACREBS_04605 [Nitrososphaerales archaeon]
MMEERKPSANIFYLISPAKPPYMTDPLTGKELVQKSYEYIDKLTKECAKVLLEEYNKTHKKFQLGSLPKEASSNIIQWFEKRDRNVRLSFDPASTTKTQPTQIRIKFRGNTKDADFVLDASAGLFIVPGTEISDQATCFVKTITINADRNNFSKRKP